ncbi:hypothetical protein [Aureibacillus halotolerans]|uniref:Ferric iron reductase protein FhuF n=1 Tax=Aureibacillus halotolerans TaxID=1508390 RepID=A0A4R6U7N9_9BACI|nr:hypothetical protein [Aureibacillus halotolerans]TDQ40759.1 ferric iron reductase protein FhuF [Aureibacillus halotolerans]
MTATVCPESMDLEALLRQTFVTELRKEGISLRPSYRVSDLLDSVTLRTLIELQRIELGDPDDVVIGTMFAKRYSVYMMAGAAAFSLYDTPLSLRHDNVAIYPSSGATMHYETELADVSGTTLQDADRRESFPAYITQMEEHLAPLFAVVSAETGAHSTVLWSLVAHNIQSMYLRLTDPAQTSLSEKRRQQIVADQSDLLDSRDQTKLGIKLRRFVPQEGHAMLLRKHCCLAFKTRQSGIGHGYCSTCPRQSKRSRK